MTRSQPTELRVNGESLQQLYNQYLAGVYVVNRRYQRKLVWNVDEKQRLIDSIRNDLPVPLILLAEPRYEGSTVYEIIDGLQRLNAIFSFIENQFAIDGEYFDLETLGDTKYLRDSGDLVQKEPVLSRQTCLNITNYLLPVSTYRSASDEEVDEVFRRINSSGRKLSYQEIRQAGVTSSVADLVRRISASVRGDATLGDTLTLQQMPQISITNRDLEDYGIDEQEIFWIKQGILDRDSVRESRDEELVLDLLLDMVLDPIATTGSEYRNAAYGRGGVQVATYEDAVEPKIQVQGADEIYDAFFAVKAVIDEVLVHSGKHWAELTITQQNPRGIPRYFHAIFLAVHKLVNIEHKVLADAAGLVSELTGFWDRDLSVPQGGGNWGRNRKAPLFEAIRITLQQYFEPSTDPVVERQKLAAAKFESTLQMALTETSLFELKQGFCKLSQPATLDTNSLEKVLRTASAMANTGPKTTGFIFFGVADKPEDAARVHDVFGVDPLEVGEFLVTGTEHELQLLGRSIDTHLRWMTDFIRNSKLNQSFAESLIGTLAPFRYDNRLIWSMKIEATDAPVEFDNKFFRRSGTQTLEVTGQDLGGLFARFRP